MLIQSLFPYSPSTLSRKTPSFAVASPNAIMAIGAVAMGPLRNVAWWSGHAAPWVSQGSIARAPNNAGAFGRQRNWKSQRVHHGVPECPKVSVSAGPA